MISTVTSKLDWQYSAVEAIKGLILWKYDDRSKISAMKIIDDLEETKEDYTAEQWVILPNGDFDFNVVIRSVLYNQENKYVSFSGSAITALSTQKMNMKNVCSKQKPCVRFCNN
jgi:para-aminobenzoate synthetase component 1